MAHICGRIWPGPELPWREHFIFARAASAHKIQHLGNEAGLPGVADVQKAQQEFTVRESVVAA